MAHPTAELVEIITAWLSKKKNQGTNPGKPFRFFTICKNVLKPQASKLVVH